MGNISPQKLFELMNYARCRHGVSQFVIDSFMKCGVSSDDYNEQKNFMNDLVNFAKHAMCHVHLVAHARKGKDEKAVVGKMEIKGSSDIFNMADNCLTVWRNKTKEEGIRDGDAYSTKDPDAIVFCDKQRETGWEGKILLQFLPDSLQYVSQTSELKAYKLWRPAGLLNEQDAKAMEEAKNEP